MINLKLLEFSLCRLAAHKSRYLILTLMFSLIIFLSSSVFFITGALKKEASYTVDSVPDIIVSAQTGGMKQFINADITDRIIEIPGVAFAEPRMWGLYKFEYLNTNFTIIGTDIFSVHKAQYIEKALDSADPQLLLEPNLMITGEKLADTFNQIYNSRSFSFQKPDGNYIEMKIGAVFKPESQMISSDVILMQPETASEILGIPMGMATDIAVYIPNPTETDTIISKITNMLPNAKITTKDGVKASYQNMFDYKSGIFLLLFSTCLVTFFMIVFDRLSGMSNNDRKQIAVLKAIGYTVSDILKISFYEAAAVYITAFLTGVFSALAYVYQLNAPLLKSVFIGYSYMRPEFTLPFYMGTYELVIIFFSTVPIYAAAVIIPAWKAAVTDAGESIR